MQHPLPLHIVGGDFNTVMHPDEDRRSCKPHRARSGATLTHAGSPLSHMVSTLNRLDPWRLSHPTDREFTFYSPSQDSLARLYYLFCSSLLLPSSCNSTIHDMTISDHSPISLPIDILQSQATPKTCKKFPNYLAQNEDFLHTIRMTWSDYVCLNQEHMSNPILF